MNKSKIASKLIAAALSLTFVATFAVSASAKPDSINETKVPPATFATVEICVGAETFVAAVTTAFGFAGGLSSAGGLVRFLTAGLRILNGILTVSKEKRTVQ